METQTVAGRPLEADESRRLTQTNQPPRNPGQFNQLISSEDVEGTNVYDMKGGNIGEIDHLMIDKYTGHVEYAVMSFGGFLGIGESYHPLPWRVLTYDVNLGGYVIDIVDRSQLEKAPRYTASSTPEWNRDYRSRVDDYWMMPGV